MSIEIAEAEKAALASIRAKIVRPADGLPDQVFRFALHVTPMINVDLLVFDGDERVLWAWRSDQYGEGWHIPGGIIRAGETIAERIAHTARGELGAEVRADPAPGGVVQLLGERGSFISLIFRCRLESALAAVAERPTPEPGELSWFATFPDRVYPAHEVYRELLPMLRQRSEFAAPVMADARFCEAEGWSALRGLSPSVGSG